MVVVVLALLTVCATPVEVLALKLASPLYVAVMVLPPAVVEVSDQDPAAELRGTVQLADPSLTVTVSPLGIVPAPGALIATLTATEYACPTTVAVARLFVIVVVVAAGFTVCAVPADALVLKLESPA